jgi:alkylation response protein AidB-like acyl-CoA dehydrogenase
MDLNLSDDQEALKESFAGFFADVAEPGVVRAAEPLGFDDKLWEQLVRTGAHAMGLPEDLGGGGAGFLDMAILAREYGRRIAPVPLVESMVAGNLLAAAGAPREMLDAVVGGSMLATVALAPAAGGVARLVPAGAVAEIAVVLDGDELVALQRPAGARPHADSPENLGSSPLADWPVSGPGTERRFLADGARARALHRQARTEWQLVMAAALDGLRAEALRIGVDYVKSRVAFGVPIGWFQAVQHRLADVATAGEGAELLTYEAAWARDQRRGDADQLATMAFLYESSVAQLTTRESLQFHGGYGYTLEYDIQLYFRRAKAWPLSLGDPSLVHRRLAVEMFTPES